MNLQKLFNPENIAIVGISLSNQAHPANIIYNKNVLRYQVNTFGVNPKGGRILGKKIYTNISEIPVKIDLAVIAVQAVFVLDALTQCIKNNVKAVIIISGGFGEIGERSLQEKIVNIAKKNDVALIGPNCLGIYSPPHMDTFFLPYERLVEPKKGNVGLISQSGGILLDLMTKMKQENVGISRAVSIGNKAIIDEIDLLKYFETDENTKVVGIYLEGFKENKGREFLEFVNNTKKPVIVFKTGKTESGIKAIGSHTASMAGDYIVFHELLRHSRAIEAVNEVEFIAYCEAFGSYPDMSAENICIVSGSGGHGTYASDLCSERGLNLVEIPEDDKKNLRKLLSTSISKIASIENPVDLTGSSVNSDFFNTIRFLLEKDYIDGIVLLMLPYVPGVNSDVGAQISHLVHEFSKPVFVYIPRVDKYDMFIEGFESNFIPVQYSVEGAVYMADALSRMKKWEK